MKKKTICEINFLRINGSQILKLKTTKSIEDLFKAETTETSSVYQNSKNQPLEFYRLTDKLSSYVEKYNSHITKGNRVIIRDYGTDLIKNGYSNLSILRTKGVANGLELKIDRLILDEEVKNWINDLAYFLKFVYANFVEKADVRAVINMEV